MARDLIPPPSPAGRPQTPDGTPNLIELPPEPAALGRRAGRWAPPPGPSQFRNRFGFLLGALAGVFIAAALVVAIVVASNGSGDPTTSGLAPNWSRWQPSDTTIEGGAQEIADHVGAEYKHPDGQQLVDVTAGAAPGRRRRCACRVGPITDDRRHPRALHDGRARARTARSRAARRPRRA